MTPLPLPDGVSARLVETASGLSMHILEAGSRDRPLILLLHGFPELAFSFREVMPALAAAGYWVVAPDQRGYGRTTGWDAAYDGDLRSYGVSSLVRDALALVHALERETVECVVGHDFGSSVAAWAALLRGDVFRRAVLMSAPFGGPPGIMMAEDSVHRDLADLPRPRKHYQWYYSTRAANADMLNAPQGLESFLRAYFHKKSADWPGNRPRRLRAWAANELAKLPTYYVMDLEADMPASVAGDMPSEAEIAACRWLPAEAYSGRQIEVPVCFIAGASDWGIFQKPGAFERMETEACADYQGSTLIERAGHWVQQEQPERVVAKILGFLG
jgi:pimeloyl-ACP methyl ester carboxylesterase